MKIAGQYSFNEGLQEITNRYPHLLDEVKDTIRAVSPAATRTKLQHRQSIAVRNLYNPTALTKAFKKALYPKGWERLLVDCESHTTAYLNVRNFHLNMKDAFRSIDFVKDRLGVEMQIHSLPICSVCAKMTIFRNLDFIDCGIEIVPVKALALEMSSGVSYFEQFVWDLENRGVADIDVPVLILGIDA